MRSSTIRNAIRSRSRISFFFSFAGRFLRRSFFFVKLRLMLTDGTGRVYGNRIEPVCDEYACARIPPKIKENDLFYEYSTRIYVFAPGAFYK